MQRFSLSVLALCLFVAVLASALPAQNKRDFGDEAFHMADDFMNDPAFQTGGGVGQATVITPTNGPKPTPAPASATAPAKAHAPMASSSSSPSPAPSSTPTPSKSTPVTATTTAFTSTGPDTTATPSGKKDDESFLGELPIIGDAMRLLGGT